MGVHRDPLLQREIINTVTTVAKVKAGTDLICGIRRLWRAPRIAGGRNRKRQSAGTGASPNLARQKEQTDKDDATLAPSVGRETDPTTKPHAHDHRIRSIV